MKTLCQFVASLLCVGLFSTHCLAYEMPCETTMDLSIKQREGSGIGHKQGYSSLELFSAFRTDEKRLFFLDLRGHHLFHNNKLASNVGLGYRQQVDSTVLGINGYYDARDMRNTWFQQVGVGIEVLSDCIDFRCNGYTPIGRRKDKRDCDFNRFEGHAIFLKHHFYRALQGFDAEFGRSLLCCDLFKLYGAIGAYYFSKSDSSTRTGGKIRLKGDIGKYFSIEISDSYDKLFHNNFQGYLAINIPLYHDKKTTSCNPCALTMAYLAQKPVRQEIIPASHSHKKKEWENQSVIHVNNQSTNGNGTFENPYSSLTLAQDNSKKGDIIYVQRGDGSSYGAITLQDNQKLLGAGIDHRLCLSCGKIVIPALVPCQQPTLEERADVVVTLANSNWVSGFKIIGENDVGISGNGINGAVISHNAIHGCDVGIEFLNINNGSIVIIGNEISESSNEGMYVQAIGGSPSFNITHNNVHNNGNQGIDIHNDNGTPTYMIQYNNSSNNDQEGIQIANKGTAFVKGCVEHNILNNADNASGIRFLCEDGSRADFAIRCNQACDNADHGIELDTRDSSQSTIHLSYNDLCNNGERGVNADNEDHAYTTYIVTGNRMYNNSDNESIKIENKDSATVCLNAVGNYGDKDIELDNDGGTFTVKAENDNDLANVKNNFATISTNGDIDYSL